MVGIFCVLGIFKQPVPVSQVGLLRGRFGHPPSVDIFVVVKVRFQKEKPERSHCDLVERPSPWDKGDEQCWPYSHSWKPQHRLLMTNTVFQRSSSSYQPPRQPAQEMPAYLGREFDRNQNTAYNEVRWTKEGNVDFPIQNLGHDAGDGCMWSKVLYAWK